MYLQNAFNAKDEDPDIARVLYHDVEALLSQAKKSVKQAEDQTTVKEITNTYHELDKLRASLHFVSSDLAKRTGDQGGFRPLEESGSQGIDSVRQQSDESTVVPDYIFAQNIRPPTAEIRLPEADERLNNIQQLVRCLGLLKDVLSLDVILDPAAQNWLHNTMKDTDEQGRLRELSNDVIQAFKRRTFKDAKDIAEVVCLAPVLGNVAYQDLLGGFHSEITRYSSLNLYQLEGLAQLIQGAHPGHLSAGNLVEIVELLGPRLMYNHQQSLQRQRIQLALAISHVLDAMADIKVTDMEFEKLHKPISSYLDELKTSSDPFLVYLAAYAYQALLCVPDEETAWQPAMSHTKSSIKSLSIRKFITELENIQKRVPVAAGGVNSTNEGVGSQESGQSFLNCLEEGLTFVQKCSWYSALRGADVLIRDGELVAFKKLVCEAPCRYDPAFQWGVCQRLGEIAADPMGDVMIRRGAIAFLGEIYRNDDVWGQQASIKQWILDILAQLSLTSDELSQMSAIAAVSLLRKLGAMEDVEKQVLYRTWKEQRPTKYPPKIALPDPTSPSLLDCVQKGQDIKRNLCRLKKQRIRERGNPFYIRLEAQSYHPTVSDTRFPLMDKVKEFLRSSQKVFLLLGDSGAGKSTFSRELEFELWRDNRSTLNRHPLYIDLPTIDRPEQDLIRKQLKEAGFSESQIQEMKEYHKFILICDGYDESQQTHNLYTSNRLNQPGEWDAQMIVTCRTEFLEPNYRSQFWPGDGNYALGSPLVQEAVIAPFSIKQVMDYTRQYVSVHKPLWNVEDYKSAITVIPNLSDLVTNPLLMTLSLDVLPHMVDPGQFLADIRVYRIILFDHFVEQWIDRGKKRLSKKEMIPQVRESYEKLVNEGFSSNCIGYFKRLAMAIYKEQGYHPVVEYSQIIDGGSWKDAFFGRTEKQLLLEACPLTQRGDQYRFVHQSLLEYGMARAVFDPQERMNRSFEPMLRRQRGMRSTSGFIIHGEEKNAVNNTEQELNTHSPLFWRSFVDDHAVLELLKERVQLEPKFKEQLLAYIEYSKTDKRWSTVAANAITILVQAGVQFIETDFRGIQIPGADLSYGVFDSVQFQDADMRKVNFRGAWLRQTDLSRADMTDAQFGQQPYLYQFKDVRYCVYSPDGKLFIVGLGNCRIKVYSTSGWELVRTLEGHDRAVQRIEFSPKGELIVSASWDKTVRLWNVESGKCLRTLTGHTEAVHGIAFSPHGDQVASASDDKTVRLWNTVTGHCVRILSGQDYGCWCVAYSREGNQIASGGLSHEVRLWNIETGECSHVFTGHNGYVWSIAFSPQGDRLASCSYDKTVRLWDVKTGATFKVLSGHTRDVFAVAFSPQGDQIASGGKDATVRIWDVESGMCRYVWTGHTDEVISVVYSPKGDQVASGGYDKAVRLWDVPFRASRYISSGHNRAVNMVKCSPTGVLVATCSPDTTVRLWNGKTGVCCRTLNGHTKSVSDVAFSPHGNRVVSGGEDKEVRLWDVDTGACRHIFKGHTEGILSIAYSPQGNQIASSSSDKTVRLWNVATGECCGSLDDGQRRKVLSVAYSPDGRFTATGSQDRIVLQWTAGIILDCMQVAKVVFSPQGNQLASAGDDGSVRLWNVKTGSCCLTLDGHHAAVVSVAFSHKGDLLASVSKDNTVRLWNAASGLCRGEIKNFQGRVWSLDWLATTEADYLITGCRDRSLLKWQIIEEGEQCRAQLCWRVTNGLLNTGGIVMEDVKGITELDKQVLSQRGTENEED
ncbi:MAG: hypothetical protein J3Q66DRAFT_367329 [Benniella sp.]|nr:MAG: hypothetical protein J3Q66DRAFT_367329 [Benniella sp.]